MKATAFGWSTLRHVRPRPLRPVPPGLRAGLIVGFVILASLLGIGLLYGQSTERSFDIGAADTVAGLYPPERNERFSYAYLRGKATFEIPSTGRGAVGTTIRMGGPNAEAAVFVAVGGPEPLVTIANVRNIRTYHLLLPSDDAASAHLSLTSTLAQPTGESRRLGALLDHLQFRSMGTMLPPASALWAHPLALIIVWLTSGQMTRRLAIRTALLILAGLALCVMYERSRWQQRVEPSQLLTPLLVAGLVVVTARTVIDPHRRAWLRSARWLTVPLVIMAATRLGIIMVAYIADPLMSDGNDHGDPKANVIVEVLTARWDSGFYFDIANNGYFYNPDTLSSVAFFPLLPLLIRIFTPVFGSAAAAGLIVVNTALLGAAIMFYRLVEMEWGIDVAERAVWYLLIFPMSFFGSFVYSESLLLFSAIGALLYARRGRWGIAACLGICAAMSRFVGIVVAPMLLIEWWMQRRREGVRPPLHAALAACAVPLGTAAYMLYLQQTFDDPIAFVNASANWGRAPGSPLTTITAIFQRPVEGWIPGILAAHIPLNDLIDLLAALTFIVMGCVLLAERRWSEASFVLLAILITFNSGLLASQRRYVWVLFPVFIILARWGQHQWVDRVLTALFLIGLGLFTAMIANHYWVA